MDRLIIGMLPARIRARHGDELADMLDGSPRPVLDRADVVIAGVGLRLGRATRPLLVAAVVGIFGFALGLVHAVGNLQHGVVEIQSHWWSTATAAGLAFSCSAATLLGLVQRRAAVWNRGC